MSARVSATSCVPEHVGLETRLLGWRAVVEACGGERLCQVVVMLLMVVLMVMVVVR